MSAEETSRLIFTGISCFLARSVKDAKGETSTASAVFRANAETAKKLASERLLQHGEWLRDSAFTLGACGDAIDSKGILSCWF